MRFLTATVLLAASTVVAHCGDEPKPVRVLIETDQGDMEVELDARAPKTVANFLRYVDGKFYDGGRFHRTVTPGRARPSCRAVGCRW